MFAGGFAIETIRLGLKNLKLHKLRSFLTALGIIFGTGAVICMLSVSEGASEAEMQLIRLLGTQNIIVKSVRPDRGSTVSEATQRMLAYGITRQDAHVIRTTIPHVRQVIPLREVAYEVTYSDRRQSVCVVGTTPQFFNAIHITVAEGRALTPHDMQARKKVCVIGDAVRAELFQYEDPIGRTLTVMNPATGPVPYEVVGVLRQIVTAGEPAKGLGERDINHDVYIPVSYTHLTLPTN